MAGRPRKAPGELGSVAIDRHGGKFRARTRVRDGAGKMVPITASGATPEEARRLIEAKARQVWAGLFIEVSPATTVAQLAQIWLASPRVQKLEQSSIETYEANVRTILMPRIAAVPVSALTAGFLSHFIDKLQFEESSAYAARAKRTLSPLLDIAVKQGIFDHNPVKSLDRLSHSNEERDFLSLTVEQVPLVLMLMSQWRGKNPDRRGGVRPNWQLLLDSALIALGSSARPGEVLAIRREDVRFTDAGTMQVRIGGTVSETKKYGNVRKNHPKQVRQKRWITVPEFTASVLRRRMARYTDNPDGLLLATKTGTPYSVNKLEYIYREFRSHTNAELSALGIEDVELFTPKVFRKTAASIIEGGGDLDLARKFLGHADERTTRDHYLAPETTVPDRTADILEQKFEGVIDLSLLGG